MEEVNNSTESVATDSAIGQETPESTDSKEANGSPEPKREAASNWKRLNDSRKEAFRKAKEAEERAEKAEKESEELKRKLAEKEATKTEPEEGTSTDSSDEADEKPYDDVRLELFVIKNGFQNMEADIKRTLETYPGISFEDAATFAKAMAPKTSKSKTSFDLSAGKANPGVKKKEMSDEEAVETLSAEEYLAFARSRKDKWVTR